jgi:D-alanine-D-alanine ligase
MPKTKLALLMGGRSSEREISLASGLEVLQALDPERYDVSVFDPATDMAALAASLAPGHKGPAFQVAFPVLHGPLGEDGAIQGFLELMGLPYVGSGILASAICMDKRAAKDVYRREGLLVAADLLLSRDEESPREATRRALSALGLPLVIKPLDQGSSVGLSIARTERQAFSALKAAWAKSSRVMAESYIFGREFTCAVLGNRELEALPPIEIVPAEGHLFFDYEAKYTPGQALEICPASISPEDTLKIQGLAIKAHAALGCRGLSRSDFILSNGEFYFLETNTLPGMTSNSLLPKAASAAGLAFPKLLDRLIDLALERG